MFGGASGSANNTDNASATGGNNNNNLSVQTKGSPSPTSTSPTNTSSSAAGPHHPGHSPRSSGVGSIPNGLDLEAPADDDYVPQPRSQSISLPSHSSLDAPQGEKKRRSSGIAKAGALFANAKQSLHLSGSSPHGHTAADNALLPQSSAIQKLGKTDPALIVPQGSLNNSAGESRPGPRSTFRVGVTEDKNKKCRRTMEDTHAYLYNFLATPAPKLDDASAAPSTSDLSAAAKSVESIEEHVVETDNGYFAIFDGHAGTFAADWCGKKLHVLLEDVIRKNPNSPIPELLDQTFTSVDQQLDKLPLKNSGCTAICAVLRWEDRIPSRESATGSASIAPAAAKAAAAAAQASSTSASNLSPPSQSTPAAPATPSDHPSADGNLDPALAAAQSATSTATAPSTSAQPSPLPKLQSTATRQRVLYTANVGDARIVLCRNGKALRLSYDHKGSDENEGRRISNAGGLILNNRVNGVLAVTRALGDSYMKDLVTGHPYTTETVIQPDVDEFLILACDGLWDVCSDQEAVDLVRHTPDAQLASKMLVEHALSRFSTDNLSCMIVRFDSAKPAAAPIGVDGDDPAHAKGGVSEADHIVAEARKSLGPLSPARVESAVSVEATASPTVAVEAIPTAVAAENTLAKGSAADTGKAEGAAEAQGEAKEDVKGDIIASAQEGEQRE